MRKIKEIKPKKDEEDSETSEEELEEKEPETIDEFVESEIQNPDILNISDITLKSGQQLPEISQILQPENANLEGQVGGTPTTDSEEETGDPAQHAYQTVEGLYSDNQREDERNQRKAARQQGSDRIIGVEERAPDLIEMQTANSNLTNLQRVGMIHHNPQGSGGIDEGEIYEVGRVKDITEQQGTPSAQGDERIKKYQPRR